MNMQDNVKYKRVLLKLSGESLSGDQPFGYDTKALHVIADDIKQAKNLGVEICIVVGGGNICRGAAIAQIGVERVSGDHMGMLATVMNALALQSVLESVGITTRVQSAIPMMTVCEPYIRRKAIRHMEKGRVVIFAAGTGMPYVTTDTNAALRAAEMGCDAIFKGTQVDGIYTADPKKDATATKYERLTYTDVLARDLKVMDAAAISLARENKIPILIFAIHHHGELAKVLKGQGNYTLVE
ncbi:MAG: pyrH [Candidatus Midichloriaceae bacterium]|jgi:uridylate kinase|nr:pyrH [Candidatus Midichloriaceae bacterium]